MGRWVKLIKFIKKYRNKGLPHFEILSTNKEIIIVARDEKKNIDETIRLLYK